MKRIFLSLFIFTLLISTAGLVVAQEPEIGTAADNACNEGGPMAGKCDIDWEWICGWHLARWTSGGGWGGTYTMPTTCTILLPPRPPVIVVEALVSGPTGPAFPSVGCVRVTGISYANFNGGFALPANSLTYNAGCVASLGFWGQRLISSPPPFDATALCLAAFGTTVVAGPFGGDNVYTCN